MREERLDNMTELDHMIVGLKSAPSVFQPAPFWSELNGTHMRQLREFGFENFKRTVNTRYFNWLILGIVRHQLGVFADLLRHPRASVFRARLVQPQRTARSAQLNLGGPSAWVYAMFVAAYAELLRRSDPLHLIERLEEPLLGNPLAVVHRGRLISQDLCNSIHELYSIFGSSGGSVAAGASVEIAELGAGYGRLAFVLLSASSRVSYTIIDVPPALYVSQRYLTSVLPSVPTFRYREWRSFEDVRADYEAARLRFVLPHQAEQLRGKSIDTFINISSLHEMTREQVERFFRLMDRLSRGTVYTKQWRRSRAGINGIIFGENDYPVPKSWSTAFHRRHPIQTMFFEALYDVH